MISHLTNYNGLYYIVPILIPFITFRVTMDKIKSCFYPKCFCNTLESIVCNRIGGGEGVEKINDFIL